MLPGEQIVINCKRFLQSLSVGTVSMRIESQIDLNRNDDNRSINIPRCACAWCTAEDFKLKQSGRFVRCNCK